MSQNVKWLYDRFVAIISYPIRRTRATRRSRQSYQRRDCTSSSLSSSSSRQIRIPPPHSHLYRHSPWFNYPFLCNSYNGHERLNNSLSNNNNNDKDRNVVAAMMSIIVIATLATALAQPKWFSVTGGHCNRKFIGLQDWYGTYTPIFTNSEAKYRTFITETNPKENHKSFIASENIKETLTGRKFSEKITSISIHDPMNSDNINNRVTNNNNNNENCITGEIVTLQRTIIALCFFAIMFNLIQFFMDTMGTSKKWANTLRQHAIGNILGVLLCVVIIGVCYLVSNLLEKDQIRIAKLKQHSTILNLNLNPTQHIEVKFELSYYLVTLSGLLAIIAAACNLLRKSTHYQVEVNDMYWNDDLDTSTIPIDDDTSSSPTTNPSSPPSLPPPPPTSLWNSSLAPHSIPIPIPHQASSFPPPPPYTP